MMIPSSITHRLRMVDRIYGMQISDDEQRMLSSVFTLLMHVDRFKGGVHLPPEARDNTCDHTFNAVRLAGQVFAQAGTHNNALKHRILHMILVHDMGEAFGEFTSLDSRVKAARRFKIGKMAERDITDFVLSWAAYYRHTPAAFFAMMRPIQHAVLQSDEPEAMAHVALDAIKHSGLPPLDAQQQRYVNRWMHFFDEVEGITDRSFAAAAAKMIEKLQSQAHFAQHSGTGGSVPFAQATSASAIATLSYAERKIGDVFALAHTDEEKALAHTLRDTCYANIQHILETIPPVIAVHTPETKPEAGSPARGPFTAKLLERHRQQRHSLADAPLDVETRFRIADWYKKAIADGYVPKPGESLIDRYLRPEARLVALRA